MFAGDEPKAPLFPTPTYFRTHFGTPSPRVELRPPARLQEFAAEGKLQLSLRAFLDLVMANSPEIEIQRLSVVTQQNAIERAFGAFDPTLNASFSTQRTKSASSSLLDGASSLNTLYQPASFTYSQKLETGTSYSVGFLGSKTSTNSSFSTYNPALSSQISLNFTQPLIRNRGAYINRLPVIIARGRLKQAVFTVRDQVTQLVAAAENVYWQVVQDRENLRVQEEALKLNDASLKRARRELELGAASPLDIYQPEADYATAQISVSQARFQLQQSEDKLRRQIGADLDPGFRQMPVVLTESVLPPTSTTALDPEAAVNKALGLRPDLKAVVQSMNVDDLNIKSATNRLRPDFSLVGNYLSAGRGGTYTQRSDVFNSDGSTGTVVTTIPGGLTDSLNQMFHFSYPTYLLGVKLTLPIRDRAANADLADALVQKRLDTLARQSAEKLIRQQVLNAVSQVEASKNSVKLALVNRDLYQKVLDAQQKKYELGVNTIFFVLSAQRDLATANSLLVTQSTSYRVNLLNLLQMTGELLDERGIKLQ